MRKKKQDTLKNIIPKCGKKTNCCRPAAVGDVGPPLDGGGVRIPDCPVDAGKYRLICERDANGCTTFWEIL